MVKKVVKTNPNLIELINKLYEQSRSEDAAIWKDVADRLSRSNRRTAEVNLSDIAILSFFSLIKYSGFAIFITLFKLKLKSI